MDTISSLTSSVTDQERALSSRRIELSDPAEAVEYFYQQGWTDGLPIVPPTPERVSEFLDYAGKLPGDILGMIPARNRVITAEKVAINAVMAGCLSSYMPVIVTAIEAMCQEGIQPARHFSHYRRHCSIVDRQWFHSSAA
jgi:hypothetical protein